jgi:hypothetical protein
VSNRSDVIDPRAVEVPPLPPGPRLGDLCSLARNPVTLFRGTPQVMAHRLAETPTTGTTVQLNGDATLANFGLYRTAEDGLVFDFTEFDETHPGPWEWDVRRLAADLAVAGRSHGFTAAQRRRAVVRSARRYREAMQRFSEASSGEVARLRADPDEVRRQYDFGRAARRVTARAGRTDGTTPAAGVGADSVVTGRPGPAGTSARTPTPRDRTGAARDRVEAMRAFVEGYAASLLPEGRSVLAGHELTDVARTLGRGADPSRRGWLLQLTSRSGGDTLLLEATRARRCGLEGIEGLPPALGGPAERVARGRRLTQERDDPFVGWHRLDDDVAGRGDYQVHRASHPVVSDGAVRVGSFSMSEYAELCAWTLAHAHARSGDRHAIAAHLVADHAFDQDLADFAEAYADLNDRDHRRLVTTEDQRSRPRRTTPVSRG